MSAIAQPAPVSTPPPSDTPGEIIYRLSVEQYHQMIDAGILIEGDPIELLEGLLVQKMSKKPAHPIITKRVRIALERLLSPTWSIEAQDPITTTDSEPEPDISVIKGDRSFQRHPSPREVPLVVEVADTTIHRDRGVKKRLYARAKIAVYWIVNLVDRQIEVYTSPSGPTAHPDYRKHHDYGPEDMVPVIIEGKEVGRLKVSEVLP